MRRTRHVVLPVRSWQYIGLLVVSLACLTLGLVSRDREGHSGNLAGPELTHRAPHEVDACPNLNPLTKMLSCPIVETKETAKPVNDQKIEVSRSKISPLFRQSILSRSLSLDRKIGSQQATERSSRNRDLTDERLSRSRTRGSDNESINRLRQSRFRTIAQSRDARSSLDPASLSRSRDLSNRAIDRYLTERRSLNLERRLADRTNSRFKDSRSTERHELNEIRYQQNRKKRLVDQQNFLNLARRMSDHRDSRSLSAERRVQNKINRQELPEVLISHREYRDMSRNRVDQRSEIRARRSRSIERRTIERQERERLNHHEDRRKLLDHSARIARGDIDRNNNLNHQNRKRSLENRRALPNRVANQERRSRLSVGIRDSRGDLIRSSDRRSLSRSMERLSVNDLGREALSRRTRSFESNIERSSERISSSGRRSLIGMKRHEINHAERRRIENRFAERKSLDRATLRISLEDLHRERINRSQRIASRHDSRENTAIRENSRAAFSQSRFDLEKISRERKERLARSSRSVDRNSVEREIARIRDSRNHDRRSRDSSGRRDLTLERREKTSRLYRSLEKRKIVPQKSRETERASKRVLERRVVERQVFPDSAWLDSRRSSNRKIYDSSRSREGSGMVDRRLERNLEMRTSHGRILERRSAFNSRRSSERRIDENLKSREGSRMADRRLERNLEMRTSRGRILERQSRLDSRRSSDRNIYESSKSREGSRMADRRLERSPEMQISHGRILERRSAFDSRKSSEWRSDENSRSREESRMQDRRLERNLKLQNSISMKMMERRARSKAASLENRVLRSLEKRSDAQRNFQIRRINSKERRMARSVENRPAEFTEKESLGQLHQRSASLNIKDTSKLASLRRIVRISRVSEQNREQRRLSTERMLSRIADSDRLSAKKEQNLQITHADRNMEFAPESLMDYELSKYPAMYETLKQALVVALCTIYGLSLYNGKKSFIGKNVVQQMQRFIIW